MLRGLILTAILVVNLFGAFPAQAASADERECDLLIVGGGESGTAAAVQAARLGVKRIVLANDCRWLGGQFTAEGLGAVDEWTKYGEGRVPFPRSGAFLEIMRLIESDMKEKYGSARPGNCFCAWTTCEPRDTERLFRRWIEPYLTTAGGPVELIENVEPCRVDLDGNRVARVAFESPSGEPGPLVRARLTIDASDWGDVVRLSGAKFYAGPDLKERFDEPSAPTSYDQVGPTETNPITYNLVLRESAEPNVINEPDHYDERRYYAATITTREEFRNLAWPAAAMKPFAAAWRDTTLPKGPYTEPPTIYHHRRLVDRRHFGLPAGSEVVLVNWPLQDYPTDRYPPHVVEELDASEVGTSRKNLAEMTPRQRRIVCADAKRHSLGLLYHLQTTVAERDLAAAGGAPIVTFRDLMLTDEYGTPDKLPLKPYVREGLRTECLTMLREQDVRDTDGVQCWAELMPSDGVFGFQFNIDFHPTRRIFLNDEPSDVWTLVHTKYRNWSTDTDRSMLPLRSLVPKQIDGLIVAGKNLGVSSIVQSAVRLHGHGMLAGQAAATVAGVALAANKQPRAIAADAASIRRVQRQLLAPRDAVARQQPPGVLLWPYQDLSLADPSFVAANVVAVEGVYFTEDGVPDFNAEKRPTPQELRRAVERMRTRIPSFQFSSPPKSRRDLVEALFAALERLER